jgi:molecular chaperone GrpE
VSDDRETRPDEPERVVIRDKRRIDPRTGEARKVEAEAAASASTSGGPAAESGEVPMVEASLLDERTADLQRVHAEYANYRKRAERDRLAAGDIAVGRFVSDLLPILDDLDRARAHGDLTGALKAVADHFESVLTKAGVVAFGEVGDPFDPAMHEAVMHDESPEVSRPTCTTVLRQGYRLGDRLLRAAMVGVSDPTEGAASTSDAPEPDTETQAPADPTATNNTGGSES